MATIIDALVVTLGLQPAGFNKGRAEVSGGLKKTREEARSTGKDLEVFGKHAGDFFSRLRNEAVGLFLAFQGASSVTSFVADLITGDAATGRLAKNIGVATNELSAWQLAVKTVGGDSRDADAALSAMAEAFNSFKLTGTTGHDADFKGLGVMLKDLSDPAGALLKIAEAGERMDRTEFYARLTRLGIPEPVINLLTRGRKGLAELIEEKKRDGAASEENARQAAELQEKLADLSAKLLNVLRPAIYKVVDALIKALDWIDRNHAAIPLLTAVVTGLAIAAAGAVSPWLALATALGAAYIAYQNWQNRDNQSDPGEKATLTYDEKTKTWSDGEGRTFDNKGHQLSGPPQKKAPIGGTSSTPGAPYVAANDAADWQSRKPDPAVISLYLRSQGVPEPVAAGIVAGIVAEGGSLGMAANGAFGIGQWRGDRQRRLFDRFGKKPTLLQQIDFLLWELRGGDKGGPSVLGSSSSEQAMGHYLRDFMRPGDGLAGDLRRGYAFLGSSRPGLAMEKSEGRGSTTTTTIGEINVYTAATDAEGIARDLPGQLTRRGLTNQANRGME